MINPRDYIKNDKRLPVNLSGSSGKILAVNSSEDGYELVVEATSALTGQVIMWMFDTPPAGYLKVGATYNFDDYPALGALFGAIGGETFDVPAINFPKGSGGVDTGTEEPESVGTHGHDNTSDNGEHSTSITINAAPDHRHNQYTGWSNDGDDGPYLMSDDGNSGVRLKSTEPAGAHGHPASASYTPAHHHTVPEHTGVNQPACTLINFCIKT